MVCDLREENISVHIHNISASVNVAPSSAVNNYRGGLWLLAAATAAAADDDDDGVCGASDLPTHAQRSGALAFAPPWPALLGRTTKLTNQPQKNWARGKYFINAHTMCTPHANRNISGPCVSACVFFSGVDFDHTNKSYIF